MRIGVYFGKNIKSDATGGGAFTFQQSILNALKKYAGRHEFVVFSDDYSKPDSSGSVKFAKLQRFVPESGENIFKKMLLKIPRKIKRSKLCAKFDNALNKAALDAKIEFMWFATPAFEFVSIPYIYTVWDLQHRLQSFFPEVSVTGWSYESRERRYGSIIPRASCVVIGNEEGKRELMQFYSMPEGRIKTIPLPVPDFMFDQTDSMVDLSNYNIRNKFLFYPAQFWPHKNHILLLLALKILKEKYNLNFDLVLTGSDKGNLEYIKKKTQEFGLSANVHFLNFVPVNILKTLYRQAFALAFPSFFGPDNIPPLEAFALGCPVVAAKVAGAEYQLKDAALLFDPKDESELVNVIKCLCDDPALRSDLINKGNILVQEYTSDKYMQEIINVVDEFEPIRRCWSSNSVYKHL